MLGQILESVGADVDFEREGSTTLSAAFTAAHHKNHKIPLELRGRPRPLRFWHSMTQASAQVRWLVGYLAVPAAGHLLASLLHHLAYYEAVMMEDGGWMLANRDG